MNKDLSKPQYIIVLGTTYSGSGAVFDYLNGRGDLYDPLFGEEYLLPILPNGLMSLEAMSERAFDPALTENALIEFKDISYKLIHYWSTKSKNELSKKIPFFKDTIHKFIDEISSVDFPMKLLWREMNKPKSEIFFDKIKRFFGIKNFSQTRLLVSKNELVLAAQKMHDTMFQSHSKGRQVLLDQGGSGWNPIESTKYYTNNKIVIVTRDPRDQFAEIKTYKEGSSVGGFVDWYLEMQRHHKKINNSNILFMNFEDFVKNNEKFTKILCDHMCISSNVPSKYQAKMSEKNIGIFNQYLIKSEVEAIERSLSSFIRF
tara:strand:- start:5882 stop:6829 length:948 start_codon:yes stop_codon:yes gene_type:complete